MPAQLTDDARVWCSAFSHFAGSGPQALAEHVEYAEAQVVSALESRTGRSQRGAGRLPSLSCCQRGLILPSRAVLSLCGLACAYICAYVHPHARVRDVVYCTCGRALTKPPLPCSLPLALFFQSTIRCNCRCGQRPRRQLCDPAPRTSYVRRLSRPPTSPSRRPTSSTASPAETIKPATASTAASGKQLSVRKLEVQWNEVERVVTHVRESSQRHQGEGDNDAQGRRGVVQQFRSRHRHGDRDRSNQAHQHGINNQRENELA